MYEIKVQTLDTQAHGRDVALPVRVRTVGTAASRHVAERTARMYSRFDYVALVWVEFIPTLN